MRHLSRLNFLVISILKCLIFYPRSQNIWFILHLTLPCAMIVLKVPHVPHLSFTFKIFVHATKIVLNEEWNATSLT